MMQTEDASLKILVLCTVETGLDSISDFIRRGGGIVGLVGLNPKIANPLIVSGFTDVAIFAKKHNIPYAYIESYDLSLEADAEIIKSMDFNLVWVAGWQRLVPSWLIQLSASGVLGCHGSPDGITGGRGRSPQNWALILDANRFDLALFLITPGVDDGPIVTQRSFAYFPGDDIRISYYRVSIAVADMMLEVVSDPECLLTPKAQKSQGFYFPKRIPEDGIVDWNKERKFILRQCRALTHPYPGLQTYFENIQIILWECADFDDVIDSDVGQISNCFCSGEFLVNCKNGRILVRKWTSNGEWAPVHGMQLEGQSFKAQMNNIAERHQSKNSLQILSPRITRWLME
ncbi:hypothetical protein [Polynucleobacter difficilis]|uniref:hypothetical protein n=1 Tax=Polynucleobacter difficilis TaxID=556054 RepID=UPI000D366342|nr:hypothetical protein [Polynucleobacter difficilis]